MVADITILCGDESKRDVSYRNLAEDSEMALRSSFKPVMSQITMEDDSSALRNTQGYYLPSK